MGGSGGGGSWEWNPAHVNTAEAAGAALHCTPARAGSPHARTQQKAKTHSRASGTTLVVIRSSLPLSPGAASLPNTPLGSSSPVHGCVYFLGRVHACNSHTRPESGKESRDPPLSPPRPLSHRSHTIQIFFLAFLPPVSFVTDGTRSTPRTGPGLFFTATHTGGGN